MCKKQPFFFFFSNLAKTERKSGSVLAGQAKIDSKAEMCIKGIVSKPPLPTSHSETVTPCFCIVSTGSTAAKKYLFIALLLVLGATSDDLTLLRSQMWKCDL